MHMYLNTRIYVNVRTHICTYYVHIYTCMSIHMHMNVYVHIYIYVFMCIYIYTGMFMGFEVSTLEGLRVRPVIRKKYV